MKKKVKISMPLYLQLSKAKTGKKYHLNLNNYRNWHYNTSNNLKDKYLQLAVERLENQPTIKAKKVEVTYTLYRGDLRKFDYMNIIVIQDKFFMDALVWLGCIPDDDINHVMPPKLKYGGYDRENPRVDIEIKILEERK